LSEGGIITATLCSRYRLKVKKRQGISNTVKGNPGHLKKPRENNLLNGRTRQIKIQGRDRRGSLNYQTQKPKPGILNRRRLRDLKIVEERHSRDPAVSKEGGVRGKGECIYYYWEKVT